MQADYNKNKIMDTDRLVSQRLKERRLMLGISLKEIGSLTGTNISSIQKYEKYTDHILNRKLCKLEKFPKLSLNYLFKAWLFVLYHFKKKALNLLKFLIR